MSAHCSKCGADITHTPETWPVGGCEPCDLRAERDDLKARLAKYEYVGAALENAQAHIGRLISERDKARGDAERLAEALQHIATPNREAKATGQDARDMAAFARAALARLKEMER